jgi:hypothetical protein
MEAVGGLVALLMIMMIVVLALGFTVFWIWMLVAAIQNKGLSDGEKVGWVLAIVFLHFIGSVLYLFIAHPKRKMALAAV